MDQPALLETDKRAKEIEQEYLSSLADLNVNSKPLINMLTILAEENLEYAQIIVSAVEKHLAKVEPDVKLPILYLVDSIVKNVAKQYQTLFSQVIVHMFCGVFETVNEKIREKMFGLRQTWNEVFPQSKLYAIDIKINSMDPGWPITAQLKPKIHVNPMFLKAAGPDAAMQQQLKDKTRELLELQKRKLELELFATRRHIEEQEKQMQLRTASVAKESPPEVVRKALENSGTIGLPTMMSGTGGGLLSSAIPPAGVVVKSRIAPVPQSMINMVKTRDPRLAKQQAVAQLATPTHAGMGMAGAHTSVGALSVPPPALVPVLTMEAPNHVVPKVSVKDRLGARVRRLEPSGGSRSEAVGFDDGGRLKKHSSSTSSSSSQKSRHDHDIKSRKDRKEHSSSSSSSSSKSGLARGKVSSSTSRAGSGSGSEKRKQRTHSNSDGSPQGRKSPHSSPGKKKISSSADKSNHHSSDGQAKAAAEKSRSESKGSPTNAGKAHASRQARSSSTDSSKRQDHATSGEHHHQSVASTDAQDIDLRFSIPEKRMKHDESIPEPDRRSVDADERVPPSMGGRKASEVKNITSATDEEEAVSAMIAKDIDLRSIPLHLLPSKRVAKELDMELSSAPASRAPKEALIGTRDADVGDSDSEYSAGKKRSSTNKSEEPNAKKSKAEMLDALFGNEDVDLRRLPIGGTLLEAPPSMSSVEGQEASFAKLDNLLDAPRSPLHEKNGGNRLDIVRAKLAEASKSQEKDKLGRPLLYNKLPDDPIERRRSISSLAKPGDVDLRHLPPLHHAGSALEQDDEDSSMDSMNSNIKTIITQAQEQMDKGEITPEQYNILMKQVIQLNETQKIRQAQRIEHGKQQQQLQQQHHPQQEPTVIRIDDNGSLSGEDDVIVTSVTPAPPGSTSVGGVVNDFRGKIHPLADGGGGGGPSLGKPFDMPFGGTGVVVPLTSVPPPDIRSQRDPRRQRESKWNRVDSTANSSWPNRPGVPPPPVVVGGPLAGAVPPVLVPGGIRTGPPMAAVPSPWEKAPFPVAGSGMPRYTAPPMLPPIGIVAGQAANGGQSGPMLMPSALAKVNDSVRTINIDGIQREIRFYEETAVIFMSCDEPKEIGFQKGARMVVVDGRETFELGFNETYKSVSIDNKVYQMRLGAPTRELYIDDSWYECYFGDAPTSIFLDGKLRIFKIAGPAPQVKIGGNRNDLVAGKINMIVDAEYIIPVFLDCKVQTFEINGQAHTLQFADFLLTVVIDDMPYPVDFGKLPKVYRLRGRDYYIRFTSLPNNVQPGNVYIRDMIRTPLYRDLRTPPKDPDALLPPPTSPSNLPSFAPPGLGVPPPSLGGGAFGGGGGGMNKNKALGGPGSVPSHPPPAASNNPGGLDYLTTNAGGSGATGGGYRVEADEKAPPSASGGSSAANSASSAGGISLLANINVEELYKKIVAAGIITKLGSNPPATGSATAGEGDGGGRPSAAMKNSKDDPTAPGAGKGKGDKESKPAVPAIDPVLLDKPETLKKRQAAIVHQLFSGMQCSSCGVRFPPEQTMKYSQHLDWHFRQNRRDRDSARKAHSRKWYYDVSDWIQYEEIEDLEEREKNWFETQQSEQGDPMKKGSSGGRGGGDGGLGGGGGGSGGGDGGGDDSGPNGGGGSPQPSCPAGSDEDDRQCHMCHEVFEQFYNEESEDWHLKCAIRVDGSTYHPLCYEDYRASLTMSETTLGNDTTTTDGGGGVDGSLDESHKTDVSMETGDGDEDGAGDGNGSTGAGEEGEGSTKGTPRKKATKLGKDGNDDGDDDDDDDDVIVLPAVEPVVEEILDDEVEEPSGGETATAEDADELTVAKSPAARQPEFQERQIDEDLFIQEPNIEVTDLDEIEDRPVSDAAHSIDTGEAGDGSLLRVKIKEEPKEDDDEVDEEDALFEDVGTIESSVLEINDDQRSPRTEATSVEEDLYEDVIVEGVASPATMETSNQMAAGPKPSLDGNVELQDAPQAAVLVPNRIRINITKASKATTAPNQSAGAANEADSAESGGAIVNTNFNENSHGAGASTTTDATEEGSRAGSGGGMFDELSNDAVGSWGDEGEQNGINNNNLRTAAAAAVPAEVAFEETTNVAYERKPALAGIEFNRCQRVTSGSEASGLCSIM